jgi:peptidoglycan/LPS O-acetylase OafA/YrhL
MTLSVGKYFTHHLLAGTVGALIVCPAVLHDGAGGRIREVLASPVLRSLGLISYGIFLWHLPWMTQVMKWTGVKPYSGGFWPVLIWGGLLTLVTAWITYVLVERPLLSSRSREQSGVGVPAASPSEIAAD